MADTTQEQETGFIENAAHTAATMVRMGALPADIIPGGQAVLHGTAAVIEATGAALSGNGGRAVQHLVEGGAEVVGGIGADLTGVGEIPGIGVAAAAAAKMGVREAFFDGNDPFDTPKSSSAVENLRNQELSGPNTRGRA